eukprot:8462866-Heterocapsa_arctica.AAC.1
MGSAIRLSLCLTELIAGGAELDDHMAAITAEALRIGPWSLAIHARAAGRGRAQGSTLSSYLSRLEPILIQH